MRVQAHLLLKGGRSSRPPALPGAHLDAALRKRHFFFLCNLWGFRSDVWKRHVPRSAALAAATAAAAAAAAAHGGGEHADVRDTVVERPLAPSGELTAMRVVCEMAPSVAAFTQAVDMIALMRAVTAEPFAPLTTLDLQARVRAVSAAAMPMWVG